jgi:hypothetical protein
MPALRLQIPAFLVLCAMATAALGQQRGLPVIDEIVGIVPNADALEAAKARPPLTLRSATEAARCFTEVGLGTIKQRVDFSKQYVLLFVWTGPAQDALAYRVIDILPEQVQFEVVRGRESPPITHVQMFVVRREVAWK